MTSVLATGLVKSRGFVRGDADGGGRRRSATAQERDEKSKESNERKAIHRSKVECRTSNVERFGAGGLTAERFRYLIAPWPILRARTVPGIRRRYFAGRPL